MGADHQEGRRLRRLMSDQPISRFPVPRLEDLPEDIRARILEVQEKSGFVPNVFLALAHRQRFTRREQLRFVLSPFARGLLAVRRDA